MLTVQVAPAASVVPEQPSVPLVKNHVVREPPTGTVTLVTGIPAVVVLFTVRVLAPLRGNVVPAGVKARGDVPDNITGDPVIVAPVAATVRVPNTRRPAVFGK